MSDATTIVRCEHGRTTLVHTYTYLSGEDRFCAGDMWSGGRIQDSLPESLPRSAPRTPEYEQECRALGRHSRWVIALVDPAECECACGCVEIGAFGEFSGDQGILRCRACLEVGHPPVGRWPVAASRTESLTNRP